MSSESPSQSSGQAGPSEQPIAVNLARIHETGKTIRLLGVVLGVIAVTTIAAWAFVRIYTQEFWLEVLILFFGPTGIVGTILSCVLWYVRRRLAKVERKLEGKTNGTTVLP